MITIELEKQCRDMFVQFVKGYADTNPIETLTIETTVIKFIEYLEQNHNCTAIPYNYRYTNYYVDSKLVQSIAPENYLLEFNTPMHEFLFLIKYPQYDFTTL